MKYPDLSISFFLRASDSRSKKGAPVYCRLKAKGKRKDYSTGVFGSKENWNTELQRFDGRSPKLKALNRELDQYAYRMEEIYHQVKSKSGSVSIESMVQQIQGSHSMTLLAYYEKREKELQALRGIEYQDSTIRIYGNCKSHLETFLKKRELENIALSEVTTGFIREFQEYLRVQMQYNSSIKLLRKLRAVLKLAFQHGAIPKDPFVGIRLSERETNRVALTWEEIDRIQELSIGNSRIQKVKDLFLFQCFTGLAFSDIKALRKEHLQRVGDRWMIIKEREKTHQLARIPLHPKAQRILSKYELERVKGYLLPVPSNQKMNAYLKEVGDLAGITKELTSHIGRHTFATTVMLNEGVPEDALKHMMGLSSIKHLKGYAKMSNERLLEYLN